MRTPKALSANRLSPILATMSLFFAGALVPVQAANVLIVAGTAPLAQSAASVLNTDLSGTNTVTIVNTGVPASLAGYTQIYDVRFDNNPALTAGEMTQYVAFLNAAPGNTLFLMGENTGFTSRNTPMNQLIALAGGGTISAPAANSFSPETVASQLLTPNAIATVTFAACGKVTSPGTGIFGSSETGGGCSILFGRGSLANATQGAMVVVYDVNFIVSAPTGGGAANEVAFRQNMEQFVSAPFVAPPPTPVPTLSTWGLAILALALCMVTALSLRNRRCQDFKS